MTDFDLPDLYDHQLESVERLRHGIRRGRETGNLGQVLSAPTGSGKTVVALHMIANTIERGNRALFIVDRLSLLEQTSRRFHEAGIDHGIYGGGDLNRGWSKPIKIAMEQTIASRGWPDTDVIFNDECFVAGTPISTAAGPLPIEAIREGDRVANAVGDGYVTAVSVSLSHTIYLVRLSNGTRIRCTENHPFFADSGWTAAGSWRWEAVASAQKTCAVCGNEFRPYMRVFGKRLAIQSRPSWRNRKAARNLARRSC